MKNRNPHQLRKPDPLAIIDGYFAYRVRGDTIIKMWRWSFRDQYWIEQAI